MHEKRRQDKLQRGRTERFALRHPIGRADIRAYVIGLLSISTPFTIYPPSWTQLPCPGGCLFEISPAKKAVRLNYLQLTGPDPRLGRGILSSVSKAGPDLAGRTRGHGIEIPNKYIIV